ncbi:MAG: hypothetical protein V2A79_02450 [Planctomycetota bacterium]
MAATNKRRGYTQYHRNRSDAWNKTRDTSTRKMTTPACWNRGNYTVLRENFQHKIDAYRTLYNEAQGTPGKGCPTPATLNTFANWVSRGAIIHRVSATQINRWSDLDRKCTTANLAKNVLWNKFGKTPIKAVCKSKSGSFLVATTPTYNGRNFKFPRQAG